MNIPLATQFSPKIDQPLPRELVLVVLSGKSRGIRLPLSDRIRIGKSGDNDLVLADDTVSRHHCEILRSDAGLVVRDLGSTTYTKVGTSRVTEASLQPGVPIVIGDIELVVRAEPKRATVTPSDSPRYGDAVGPSIAMRTIFGLLERIAHTDAALLFEGEAGTGKELLARQVHAHSPRRGDPFIIVDCSATPGGQLESELFGHERGAFAGAVASRAGAFETAGRGTIFLEEVGEVPLDLQTKLLRVLEHGEYRRVGGTRSQKNVARVIATTKRKLTEEVERGKFREDLYFRLAVVPVVVPPLRSRREDIPALIEHFTETARTRDPRLSNVALQANDVTSLSNHDWPGNVRELRSVVERALSTSGNGDGELAMLDVPHSGVAPQPVLQFEPNKSYREVRALFEADFERRYVAWLLGRHSGNISAAAREAKMDRKYLYDLARKHGLRGSKT